MVPNVGRSENFFQESYHEQKLFIVFITKERLDRNTIGEVKGKGDNGVVNDDHFLRAAIGNDRQILDVDACFGSDAMLTVQAVLDYGPVLVDEVEDRVGVVLLACCENADLVHRTQVTQCFF